MKPEQLETDLLRREVAAMTAQFVTCALIIAIWRGGKQDRLLHRSCRRASLVDYFERFRNPLPLPANLEYLSPVEFEEQAVLA